MLGSPFSRISKCRCIPVLRPVMPALAIVSPALTSCPSLTSTLPRLAYTVLIPLPWSITTYFPKPRFQPLSAAFITVPSRKAVISVSSVIYGLVRSIP